jgi:hypothetical protein
MRWRAEMRQACGALPARAFAHAEPAAAPAATWRAARGAAGIVAGAARPAPRALAGTGADARARGGRTRRAEVLLQMRCGEWRGGCNAISD